MKIFIYINIYKTRIEKLKNKFSGIIRLERKESSKVEAGNPNGG
jgi:hypothetical protein